MYNSCDIAKRIRTKMKEDNIKIGEMLDSCELSKNALSSMDSGFLPRLENLCKIADYLNVSIDYLLGRNEKAAPISVDQDGIKKTLNLMTEEEVDELILFSEYLLYKIKSRPMTDGQE